MYLRMDFFFAIHTFISEFPNLTQNDQIEANEGNLSLVLCPIYTHDHSLKLLYAMTKWDNNICRQILI